MRVKEFMRLSVLCTSVAVIGFVAECQAEENSVEELIVNGTHLSTSVTDRMELGYSISADQLAVMNPSSLIEVLQQVPGVTLSQLGGRAGLTKMSVRGGDPNFTVILLDGVQVNDPTNSRGGGFDFGALDPAMVEKIDVFYGGLSAIYGSDALSGVVSIITKKDFKDGNATLSFLAESEGVYGGHAHISGQLANLVQASLNLSHKENDHSYFGDDFKADQATISLSSVKKNALTWEIAGHWLKGEGAYFPEDSGGERLAVIREPENRQFEQKTASAKLRYAPNSSWQVDIRTAQTDRMEVIHSPGIAPGYLMAIPAISSDTSFTAKDLSITSVYSNAQDTSVAFGGSIRKEVGEIAGEIDFGSPFPYAFKMDREIAAIYGEVFQTLGAKSSLLLSLRYDDSDLGSAISPRLVLKHQFGTFTASLQYSEGFKLPSFFALGHPLVGNENLSPEKGKSWELSLKKRFWDDQATVKLSAYRNNYKDLVDFDPELFSNINRAEITTEGGDVVISLQPLDGLSLSAALNYAQYDSEGDQPLRGRPKWFGFIDAAYETRTGWTLHTNVTHAGKRMDSSVPTGFLPLPASTIINVDLSKEVFEKAKISFGAKNLFDTNEDQVIGTPNPGRYVYVRMGLTL